MARLHRRFGLGGADIASLCGINPYKPPLQLYLEKKGELSDDQADNARMRWGRRLELPIIKEFGYRTNRKVWRASGALRHPLHRWQRGNIDSWQERDGQKGVVEAKTADWTKRREWNQAGVPIAYYLQLQWYIYLAHVTFGSIVVAFGFRDNDFLYFDVERDQPTIDSIVRLAEQFWRGIKTNEPPDWTYDESGLRLIQQLHPVAATPKKSLTLDSPEAVAKARRLLALRETISLRTEQKDELETWFKVQLGDASEAVVPTVATISWTNFTTKRLDQNALREDQPAVAAQYTKEQISRRFSLTPYDPDAVEEVQDEPTAMVVTSGVRQIQLD